MSIATLTSARQETQAIQRPHPLLSVLLWELRRFRASRLFGAQVLGFFCLLLLVTWLGRTPFGFQIAPHLKPGDPGASQALGGFVAGTSAWGLLIELPTGAVLLLGVLLPFINADGVTRDLGRRTHELLMTTALPTWAYIWGRYLACLVMSLGLALLSLAAIVGMGFVLHLTITDYPAPQMDNVAILWASMVAPATVLVSSVSFALGAMLPRQTTLVKIGTMLAWFIGVVILPSGLGDNTIPPAWYSNWDPTSRATALSMVSTYQTAFSHLVDSSINETQLQNTLLTIENMRPDVSAWLAPHLIEASLSLLLVALAALAFQRFRNAFGA